MSPADLFPETLPEESKMEKSAEPRNERAPAGLMLQYLVVLAATDPLVWRRILVPAAGNNPDRITATPGGWRCEPSLMTLHVGVIITIEAQKDQLKDNK